MSEKISLSPEEQELLRSVVRKRQPSLLWSVVSINEKPLTPVQRDALKGMLTDEMREAAGSERGAALKKLIERLAQT
jgi:hypothetical protein